MQGFGYGAEDFDAGLSEAIDRARKLLKNVYATGGMTASRPAARSLVSITVLGLGVSAARRPAMMRTPDRGTTGTQGPGSTRTPAITSSPDRGIRHTWGPGITDFGGPGDEETAPGPEEETGPVGWPVGRTVGTRLQRERLGRILRRPAGRLVAGPGRTAPRPGRARWPWWAGEPRRPKASRGDVRATILALLTEGPRTGYQIMSDIEERSHGAWRPSPGAVYPALQLLADEGLIIGEEAGGRRTFSLTDAGRDYIENNPDMARGAWEAMADADAAGGPGDLPRLFGEAARLGAAIAQTAQRRHARPDPQGRAAAQADQAHAV